jgi:uncharacterized protein (TIGR02145 family)
MKTRKLIPVVIAIIAFATAFAQVPQKMGYQSIVRNASNFLVVNQMIGLKISILEGSLQGNAVYVETHFASTNDSGLFSIEVGLGTPLLGVFDNINWGNGSHYIKSEIDITGGVNYSITGTRELFSVPYALYAHNSGSASTSPSLGLVLAENNSANNLPIKNLQDPMEAQDAVTKSYLENNISQLLAQIISLQNPGSTLAPTNLRGGPINYQTELTWTDISTNETGFKIERKTATENYSQLETVSANITSFTDTNVIYGTTYTYRLYSFNAVGNSVNYSNEFTIRIPNLPVLPALTTTSATSITTSAASLGGSISSDGEALITERGIAWSTQPNPTTTDGKVSSGIGSGNFTSVLTDLLANTTYYVRAFATNSQGTAYGNEVNFITIPLSAPSLQTFNISNIDVNTAQCSGQVYRDGGAPVTDRGACWSTAPNPTIVDSKTMDGIGTGVFWSTLTDLTQGTKYYVRTYATNSVGTTYGNEVNFFTTSSVDIGTQTWTSSNLDVTTYRDGTPIPQVTDLVQWGALTTGAWCYYDNDPANGAVYGKLYNWYAVAGIYDSASRTDSSLRKKFAPQGWHVPSLTEWNELLTTLGGVEVAGGKMKEEGTMHWVSPNVNATNSNGFTALPGGARYYSSAHIGERSNWWTATEDPQFASMALVVRLNNEYEFAQRQQENKFYGFSVRLVRN